MISVVDVLWHGLRDSLLMGWIVLWALIFGFLISAIVQAWVPRERIERALSGSGVRSVGIATGFGAASSSCSYAATAISKSLFQKGASAASAIAFQFASTNIVWELGFVLWVLIGWQFTAAEFFGGLVMVALMAILLRLFISRQLEEQARTHALAADTGHQHHMAGSELLTLRQRLTSVDAWSDVAHNFRGDWQMLWKEIAIGLLLAGYIAQLGNGFFHSLFLTGAPFVVRTVWSALLGPVIAMVSFVCSVGNVPLAAVLWSGGIGFAGVMAFIFADLIILPIVAIYRKYYGTRYAVRLTLLMYVTMVVAGLIVELVFGGLGLIPAGARPGRAAIFGHVTVNYKLFLNAIGVVIFTVLIALTARRGATDPVCHMKVDRAKALRATVDGHTYYFCSQHCLNTFGADPASYVSAGVAADVGAGVASASGAGDQEQRSISNHNEEMMRHKHDHGHDEAASTGAGAGGKTIDPVCGMSVDPATAPIAEHEGHRYFFCSEGCREQFIADPSAYLG
jgi:YHS domain-containing protein/uncharacterized membrane protein YraQ (UPF0718 family)